MGNFRMMAIGLALMMGLAYVVAMPVAADSWRVELVRATMLMGVAGVPAVLGADEPPPVRTILTVATSVEAFHVSAIVRSSELRASPLTLGGVESNLNANEAGGLTLPALSRQRPVTVVARSSGLS